uniref:Septin-4 n=1 Tax=Fundulus heteroclitus TaxID=8078 RepID=A0A147B3K3_FUNHE
MDRDLISLGPPTIHQLKTRRQKFGTLTRVTIGEKDVRKIHKTILLVGETGTGKSALVNALVNYAMGVTFEDQNWLQVVEEEEEDGQTSDVIVYNIFDFKSRALPHSLTIIDTPGCGDKRGVERDVVVCQRLFDLFRSEDGVREIHAVGLVMKASDNQMSDSLKYIFSSLMALFGKGLRNNTVALITHSDGTTPKVILRALKDASPVCARDEKDQPLHFTFNNRQNEARTEETSSDLEEAWRVTKTGMSRLIGFLEKVSSQQPQVKFGFKAQVKFAASIQNLEEKIRYSELKLEEMKQLQEALKKLKEEKVKKDENIIEVEEVSKEKEPIDGEMFFKAAVCCTSCWENCHYPGCTMASNPAQCEVMQHGRCTVCRKKCPVSAHVKDDWRFVTKTQKVQRTEEEYENKYRNLVPEYRNMNLLEILEKEIEMEESVKTQLIEKSYRGVVSLDQTVLKVYSLSTYMSLDFLIEKMKEKGESERLQRLQEIDQQMDGGVKALLQSKVNNSSPQKLFPGRVLIRSGSPEVYQLRTMKEKLGTLTRVTVGTKRRNKPNKTILLVGETGAGKSTLINALVNHAMGVKFEDKVWYQIVEDEKRSQTESQTSDVIVYQIFGFEGKTLPFSLTIIDTPGYGDTRGIDRDVIVSERLFDLFRSDNGIHELDSVGLVLKSSVNRLSDRLRYIFDSVMSLFGKDIEKNIVALVTHSNGKRPKDLLQALDAANIKCAKDENKKPVCFLFNNCQQEERTEEAEYLKNADKIAAKGLSGFTDFLGTSTPQKLQTTLDVLNERIRLSACIQNLQERIRLSELKQTEMKQIQEALKNYDENQTTNEKVTVEFDEAYKEKESIEGDVWLMVLIKGAVCCTICEENCHYPGCSSSRSPKDCEVMKDGRCTVCTLKCPVSAHVKGKWRYVSKTKKVQKSLNEIRKRSKRKKGLNLLEHIEKDMKKLKAEKVQLLEQSYQHVVNLEDIALKFSSVSTFVHFDFLIEKLREWGEANKIQKLEQIKNKEDEGSRSKVQSVWGKVKAAGKRRSSRIWDLLNGTF